MSISATTKKQILRDPLLKRSPLGIFIRVTRISIEKAICDLPVSPVGILAARNMACSRERQKPADLPVEQPTKFRLAINVQSAKRLNIVLPPLLLSK
jgi:hypothetical protein